MGKIIRDGNIITPTTYISPKVEPEYVSFRCYTGTALDLSWLDTSQMTQFDSMFSSCNFLASLNLSGFNTIKAQTMYSMFNGCSSLASAGVNTTDKIYDLNFGDNFNTSSVTDMRSMFSGCSSLTGLDLSKFDTSKVTDMSSMFSGCSSLTKLDISNFDFTKVTNYNRMFTSVPANCEILVKDEAAKTWITSKFSNLTNVKIKGDN